MPRNNMMGLCLTMFLIQIAVAGALDVTAVHPANFLSPVLLEFHVSMNDTPVAELVEGSVNLSLVREDGEYPLISSPLSGSGGLFSTSTNVPFRGLYGAKAYAAAIQGNTFVDGTASLRFRIIKPSPGASIDAVLTKTVLEPGNMFQLNSKLLFRGESLPGMSLRCLFNDVSYTVPWDPVSGSYQLNLTAPIEPGKYRLLLYLPDDPNIRTEADVFSVRPRMPMFCPEDFICQNQEQASSCMYLLLNNSITEEEMKKCADSFYGLEVFEIYCDEDYLGDFNANGEVYDSQDAQVMSQFYSLTDTMRSKYLECADYNRDEKIDEKDEECLEKVSRGYWYEDFCVELDKLLVEECRVIGDFNADLNIDLEDISVMNSIITYIERTDLPTPFPVLRCGDFNDDGKIGRDDLQCLTKFSLMDVSDEDSRSRNVGLLPEGCMNAYHLDYCEGTKGDLNGDYVIDNIDKLLMILLVDGTADIDDYPEVIECADINRDGIITQEDEGCLQAYFEEDRDKFASCLGCEENIGRYMHPYEICNDGYDNDCDGLVDRTSTDESEDLCICSEQTPCNLPYDTEPSTPGIQDVKVKFCYSLNGNPHTWQEPPGCSPKDHCQTITCGPSNTVYRCYAYKYRKLSNPGWITWRPGSESRTKKRGECDNGIDEDCSGSDRDCKKEKWYQKVTKFIIKVITLFQAEFDESHDRNLLKARGVLAPPHLAGITGK